MQQVGRRYWFLLALPGFCLLAAFLLGGIEMLMGGHTALAASHDSSSGKADCTSEQHGPSFGRTIVVNSGEVICSNVTSFGGEVVIQGEVRGDVVTFGGNAFIDGNVTGNVTLYGGNVTLQKSARVDGDIHLCGGRWMGTADRLHGTVFDCTKDASLLLVSDMGPGFRFWSIVTWVSLGMLLTSLLPEHVMLVRTTVKSKKLRSLILGLLTVLLTPSVLAVLIALIISIPLAIIVAVALIAAWALGTVAVGWMIGEYIVQKIAPQQNSRLIHVVAGLAVLALAGSLPYIGWLISIGTGLLGLGAVFLSRFGTKLYSQPKQPLPL